MREQSPLAGKTVQIKKDAAQLGGETYRVEDWWQNVSGGSWMTAQGNPAALSYVMRIGLSQGIQVPLDNEVLYGKIGAFGHLVHVSEIEEQPNA